MKILNNVQRLAGRRRPKWVEKGAIRKDDDIVSSIWQHVAVLNGCELTTRAEDNVGVGLADEMIRMQIDNDGTLYGPLGFFNDDAYKKVQPKEAPKILYGIKANGPLNSKIHGNVYSRISGGMVKFLIKEQEAKNALMATKVGQKMSTEEKVRRLMPHQMTTRLFEEMANLRLKQTGVSMEIVLERINERFPKDKYSSLAYGLWRIKELEEEAAKKKRRRFNNDGKGGTRKLSFFT